MLDTRLNSLLKVVDTGSYTQAAKALNLTQPAISQHIHSLEHELNIKVFNRVGNKLVLTREGKKVVGAAKSVQAIYERLHNELAGQMMGATNFNVGITHTVESNHITQAFAKYAADNVGATFKMITSTQSKLVRMLKNGELDFAIMDGDVKDDGLTSTLLDNDSIILIVSPEHAFAKKSSVTLDVIKQEKLILRLPNSGTGNLFVASLTSKNLSIDEFNVILEVDNIATIKDLVRAQYGVSILAQSACVDEIRKKQLVMVPIEGLSMEREIRIVYAKGFQYADFLNNILQMYTAM